MEQENLETSEHENITEEEIKNEEVEQITAVPAEPLKIKNPKRIEAGKKLAEYNKKAKKLMKKNTIEEKEEPTTWIPEINITLLVAIIGLGFTACDLFLRYKESIKMTKIIIPRNIIEEPQEPQDPERKFGME